MEGAAPRRISPKVFELVALPYPGGPSLSVVSNKVAANKVPTVGLRKVQEDKLRIGFLLPVCRCVCVCLPNGVLLQGPVVPRSFTKKQKQSKKKERNPRNREEKEKGQEKRRKKVLTRP